MERKFYIDTPVGKLKVYSKHDIDDPGAFPGVFVDLVREGKDDQCLACVEYDSVNKDLLCSIYGDLNDDYPTDVRHVNTKICSDSDVEKYTKTFNDMLEVMEFVLEKATNEDGEAVYLIYDMQRDIYLYGKNEDFAARTPSDILNSWTHILTIIILKIWKMDLKNARYQAICHRQLRNGQQ